MFQQQSQELTVKNKSESEGFLISLGYYNLSSILLHIFSMRCNPFNAPESPILHVYQRSINKSHQNKVVKRSRSQSFKEFQVNKIVAALQKRRIVEKQYNFEKKKIIQRQLLYSKYYGFQNYKIQTNSYLLQQNIPPKPIQQPKHCERHHSINQTMSTMLNIKIQTMVGISSRKQMDYESNYCIKQENKASQIIFNSGNINSQRTFSKRSSNNSSQRKCSIFDDLMIKEDDQTTKYKKSRFIQNKKDKLDRIKQQYLKEVKIANSDNKVDNRWDTDKLVDSFL